MKTICQNVCRARSLAGLAIVAGAFASSVWLKTADVSQAAMGPQEPGSQPSIVQFDKDGQMLKPTGYRKWVCIGIPLTPNDMNGGKAPFPEFHSVYINPAAYAQYEKTGKFPGQTVLVKELVSVGTKKATSGQGYFMGDFIGLEVAMKDSRRFQDAPGNWAYFSFGHSYPLGAKAPMQPVANCNSCHGGAADQDYVFTQYYPVLRSASQSVQPK
jgi:hypothetical protein